MPINPPPATTHGSATFMSLDEAIELGLTVQYDVNKKKKYCPYIGTLTKFNSSLNLYARKASPWPNFQEGIGHLLTIAPTRAGKGSGQIIPNLLSWIGSVLVIDIKGENYDRSAGFRDDKLHQNVFRFAPFEEKSHIWNPILSIRANPKDDKSTPEEEEDARYLTNLLITPSGSSGAAFWENSAKNFLEGLLLYVRTAPLNLKHLKSDDGPIHQCQVRERSMREVRRLLTLETEVFNELLTAMGISQRNLISQAGNCFKDYMNSGEKTDGGKLGQSILATALEQTAVWAYQRLHKATYKPLKPFKPLKNFADLREPGPNDFSFEQMRDGNTSIYLIIPPDYLTEYRSVLRVMIGFAMRELINSYEESKEQDNPPILFILDEFPQLAYMRPIEEALLYLAGYDVRLWFFVQDISQLQLHYKDSWRTFFSNTSTQCFFGVSDIATANLVSEMAGMQTIRNYSYVYSEDYSDRISRIKELAKEREKKYLMELAKEHGLEIEMKHMMELAKDLRPEHLMELAKSHEMGHLVKLAKERERKHLMERNEALENLSAPKIPLVSKEPWEHRSTTVTNISRPLITPDEVMRMNDDDQIVFMKGLQPIYCYRLSYYKVPQALADSKIKPPN